MVTELELRFVLDEDRIDEILTLMAAHIRVEIHDRRRPVAYTRTTYFDTTDLDYLRSYYRPVTRRLRIRQYASARDRRDVPVFVSPCYMELKESYGAERAKIRFAMSPVLVPMLLARRRHLAEVAPEVALRHPQLERVSDQLSRGVLRPVVTTWYRRHSFMGESGRVRLTVDENLVYGEERPFGLIGQAAAPQRIIGIGPDRILEVKCRGAVPGWLLDAVRDLTEAYGYSKYHAGMEMFARRGHAAA